MESKTTGLIFAQTAYSYRTSGIPYNKLDCQAFVEQVLRDCGINKNWRGSNDMWRNALDWRGTVDECIADLGAIPAGAWLFTIKHDGGEDKSRYHDGINAAHVGIYTGMGKGAMHSSTGGVAECAFPDSKRWTHVGLCKYINYFDNEDYRVVIRRVIDMLNDLLEG